jgi:hypothetical protein
VPVTVAERSKACTVFIRSEAGIVDWHPTQGVDVWCVCVCVYSVFGEFACGLKATEFSLVCVVLCLGRGLAAG